MERSRRKDSFEIYDLKNLKIKTTITPRGPTPPACPSNFFKICFGLHEGRTTSSVIVVFIFHLFVNKFFWYCVNILSMELVAILDVIFLVIIVLSVIWIFSIVSGYGGMIGRSFKMVGWGAVLMGLSHIIEAVSLYFPEHHEAFFVIFFHHFLAVVGFMMIAYGFKVLIKK